MPNGDILSYSIWASLASGNSQAQIYNPNTNTWTATGSVPVQLSETNDYELGPAFLLPDGRVFQLGANGNTAFYTPSTNSWATGPIIPDGLVAADVPGAMLPNGDVLFAASKTYNSQSPRIFEFNPSTNINPYSDVTPPDSKLSSEYNFQTRMLVLPTGQVLFSDGSNQLWVYTPTGTPDSTWQPTIAGIANNGNGNFTLSGQRLNGISEGASYGDDAEMSSNYPLVQLTAANGDVYYARTSNWSSTGVAAAGSGAPETVDFALPSGLPQQTYQLAVIANGIASSSISFDPFNSYWQPVSLTNYYNQVGISDGKPFSGTGLDGQGHELGTPGAIGWQGQTFSYGPANADDVISDPSQPIALPSGTYSNLTVFATAVNGNQTNQQFTIVYSNGASQTFTQSLSDWTTMPGQYSGELRANVLSQYNADGTNTGQTVYDSGYVFPLNPTEAIQSIILPANPDVKVLAMALYHDGATGQAVSLSGDYNATGISDGKAFSGTGLDGQGHELGTPGAIGWQGSLIPYGPANANDVVLAQGQSITLSAGVYSTLTLFATALNADQTNQTFTVVYSNGATQTYNLSLTNWTTNPGQYSDELRADELSQYNADGTNTGQTVYDSAYALPLNTTASIKSIILPDDPNIVIFGMLLS